MMCLSLIRYISDYVRFLPLGIVHHLLVETDILCLLVPLIEDKPWLRKTAKGTINCKHIHLLLILNNIR